MFVKLSVRTETLTLQDSYPHVLKTSQKILKGYEGKGDLRFLGILKYNLVCVFKLNKVSTNMTLEVAADGFAIWSQGDYYFIIFVVLQTFVCETMCVLTSVMVCNLFLLEIDTRPAMTHL